MIDLQGLPTPPDAPPPGSCVRLERPEPGLAVLVLDPPHRKIAVLDLPLMRDLDVALEELERDRELRGLVITGRAPTSFAAGADVDAIEALTDPALVERVIRVGQDLFHRVHRLGRGRRVTTIAAVGGPVPGGAYELSLACNRILLADDPSSRVGLPETQLGIVPAWGGCQRLPRRIGVPAALDAILTGRLFSARAAKRKGLVDRLTPPEYLRDVACDVAMGRKPCKRAKRGVWAWLIDRNPLALAVVTWQARKTVLQRTKGRYPAVTAAVRLAGWAPLVPISLGFEGEAKAASELATGRVCKSLIGIFHMMEDAKKLGRGEDGEAPAPIGHAGVVGAGVMGGGIASLLAGKGVATRLFDISAESLDAAQLAHRADLARKRKRRRLSRSEHDAAIDRLDTTAELIGFRRAELVVEAVAEKLEIKREVLGELAAQVAPDALLCTNTSSLSVDAIAEGLPHPERILGWHFFNPVKKMPLVEIVRGRATSEAAVRRVAALATRLGKTPVVVRDVAGFLVNRLLGPYLDEALRLYSQGVDPQKIDAAAEDFGMPMGPFALLDEVGLDIASHAATSLHEAYGPRMAPSRALEGLLAEGHLGKKSGRGFYAYEGGKKGPRQLSPALARLAKPETYVLADLSRDEIVDRLLLAMLNEAARCVDERVVATPAELDLATVFGMGFPPFRGGLLRWADSLGASDLVQRLKKLAAQPDVTGRGGGAERFTPAPLLERLTKEGRSFRAGPAAKATGSAEGTTARVVA